MKACVAGENSLILYFEPSGDMSAFDQVQQAKHLVSKHLKHDAVDLVASYSSLLIVFNMDKTNHFALKQTIKKLLSSSDKTMQKKGRVVELPVYYGDDLAADLTAVAQYAGLSTKQVIDIHQQQSYQVYAMGFAPGFAFMGYVDKRIAIPRRENPRKKVPKGAVAIANQQTAVYPDNSPGGWHIIGRCPIPLFDLRKPEPSPYQVGDTIQFKAINRQQYIALDGGFDEAVD